jgi:hypothetical protein
MVSSDLVDMSRVGHWSLGCLWGCLWVSVHPPGVMDVVLCNVMSKHYIFVDFFARSIKSDVVRATGKGRIQNAKTYFLR